jgi:DNA-binding MarR family transcriptional regulator
MPATTRKRRISVAPPVVELSAANESAVRVLRRFRLVFNAVKTHFQQVEKQAGIGGAQLWALSIIGASPAIGVKALAGAMDIHQATASNLVKTLVTAQMVAAERKGVDRRAVQLRLLPAGARALRRAPGPFAGVLPKALAGLDPQTLRRLDKDLATLIGAIRADPTAPALPLGQLDL